MKRQERREAYLTRSARHIEQRSTALEQLSNNFSWYRVGLFLAGLAGIPLTWYNDALGWALIAVVLTCFIVLARVHRRVDESLKKHRILLQIRRKQLARMQLDWAGIPEAVVPSGDDKHPFDLDLDITGSHSLHRLISLAVSREGSQRLAEWLLRRRPDAGESARRAGLVKELRELPGFRDGLMLSFLWKSDVQLEGKQFLERLFTVAAPSYFRTLLMVLLGLALLNIGLIIGALAGFLPSWWIFGLSLYALIFYFNQGSLKAIFSHALYLEDEIGKIQSVLHFLETYPYRKGSALARLCEVFWNADQRPSVQTRRIRKTIAAIGLRMNPMMWLILNTLFPWDFYYAFKLDRSRTELYGRLSDWIDRWADLEALAGLANFGWLNPSYTFAEIVPAGNRPVLEVKQAGHPLIPASKRICNDFQMNQPGDIALVTGSNMAGKSTFLKTLGINLSLAFAGGPVNAEQMRTVLFRIYACVKVSDSVTDGFSYFYAEVRRLKGLLGELKSADEMPVFYLIDEIFKGTNNRERYIGSRSYIKSLAGTNGTGGISTHDLELTKLAEDIRGIENFHFREEVVDGKMEFDYTLRRGPCPTTNALKIMQLEGLPVDPGE